MSNTNVVRTAVAGAAQTAQYIGKPIKKLPNSTLNQKLNIHADIDIATTDVPVMRYVAIGNGGHGFIMGGNGRVKYQSVHHTPRHAGLYNQLPFVLRLPEEDLTADQRLKYRLRRLETHRGKTYVAYYLRVLDLSQTEVVLEMRHVENGVTTSTPYVPSIEDLNPTPPALSTGAPVTTTGDYVASSAKIPFWMSPEDVQEFVKACEIIEGESGYAVISEMASVSAVDRVVQGDFNGSMLSYTDAIYAQIKSFISTAWIMEYQTDGVTLTVDVGNVEPMMTVAPA